MLFQIGCDTSFGLLDVCKDRGFEVFSGNCLNIPLKENTADGVICIAVIHHLGNEVLQIFKKQLSDYLFFMLISGKED